MSLICAGVFSTIFFVAIAIIILLLMVLIHEFGHYVVGRLLGFKINEFSVGFGKAIFSKINKRGEKISLRIFPLGGYCAFAGEEDDGEEKPKDVIEEKTDEEKPKTQNEQAEKLINQIEAIESQEDISKVKKPTDIMFNEQKAWKRMLVFVAGVSFNFISAIIFSFILLVSFGYDIPQTVKADASKLETNSILIYAQEGYELKEDDVIWEVNGTKINFAFTGTLPKLLSQIKPNTDFEITIERNNQKQTIVVQYDVYNKDTTTAESLTNAYSAKAYAHSFFEALGRCFEITFGFAWVVLDGFWQIISGQISFSELGGPISTIGMISTITQSGLANVFILLPLLSANLAVFNFLPIPALDGCHALFTMLEWIFKKPVVSRKVENMIHSYGLIALLLLVLVADIVHIIVVGL